MISIYRSPTECGVSECDRESSVMSRLWPTSGCFATKKKNNDKLCDSYEGKCVRLKIEAAAMHTIPAGGLGIPGALYGGGGVDYSGN
jgi:hypothetical protein